MINEELQSRIKKNFLISVELLNYIKLIIKMQNILKVNF